MKLYIALCINMVACFLVVKTTYTTPLENTSESRKQFDATFSKLSHGTSPHPAAVDTAIAFLEKTQDDRIFVHASVLQSNIQHMRYQQNRIQELTKQLDQIKCKLYEEKQRGQKLEKENFVLKQQNLRLIGAGQKALEEKKANGVNN